LLATLGIGARVPSGTLGDPELEERRAKESHSRQRGSRRAFRAPEGLLGLQKALPSTMPVATGAPFRRLRKPFGAFERLKRLSKGLKNAEKKHEPL
jgi:hypothetical protein